MSTTVHGPAGARNRRGDFSSLVDGVGLSLTELAAATGLGLVTLYSLRNGDPRKRRPATLIAVAAALEAARVARGGAGEPITKAVVTAAIKRSSPQRRGAA